ncbi:MAG TPA: hypothetical protein DIT01_02085 [Lentisphaeria bacterium]|nr:hypothetical protein [Lentisphaeria bacterium]|tara:strand:+ start:3668 stop:3877 length:210 start_codon:yes stop_codon:yes gene_type:complete
MPKAADSRDATDQRLDASPIGLCLYAAALVAPTLATYIPAMLAGFVWDDRRIIDNRLIKDPNLFHRIFP